MTQVQFMVDQSSNDSISIIIDLFSGESPLILMDELVKTISQYPCPRLYVTMGNSLFENIFTFIAIQYVLDKVPGTKVVSMMDNNDKLIALSDLHRVIYKIGDPSIINNFSNYLKNMNNGWHYAPNRFDEFDETQFVKCEEDSEDNQEI